MFHAFGMSPRPAPGTCRRGLCTRSCTLRRSRRTAPARSLVGVNPGWQRAWCHARDPAPPEQAVQSVAAGIVPGAAQPPAPEPAKRSPAHYLWAMLIARIFLDHIGVDAQAPRITPARGPPLWDDCDAQAGEGVVAVPAWDLGVQAAPDYQVDQRTNW